MTRSSRPLLAFVCVITLLTVFATIAVSGSSRASALDPTCSPWYYPQYTTYIYGGKGHIHDVNLGLSTINDYYNGNTPTFKVCKAHYWGTNFSPVIDATGYSFYEWIAQAGGYGVGSYPCPGSATSQASTPYFCAALANGYQGGLGLVLNPASNYLWAGYVASGTPAGSDNYYAHTKFTLPTASQLSYVGSNGLDEVGAWVGLGAYNVNTNLWQAGVDIKLLNGQAPTMYPFYEAYHQTNPAIADKHTGTQQVTPGDTVAAGVCYDPNGMSRCVSLGLSSGTCTASGGCDYYKVTDQHGVTFAGQYVNSFVPDTSSAEFIAEMPLGYPAPGGTAFTFSQYGSILFPSWIAPFVRTTDQNFVCGNQVLSAGPLASPGTFTVLVSAC